jgi:hypothetical protein
MGNISLGIALVAGSMRVPRPATGMTALVILFVIFVLKLNFFFHLIMIIFEYAYFNFDNIKMIPIGFIFLKVNSSKLTTFYKRFCTIEQVQQRIFQPLLEICNYIFHYLVKINCQN